MLFSIKVHSQPKRVIKSLYLTIYFYKIIIRDELIKPRFNSIIDRSLNYGRHQIERFFSEVVIDDFQTVLDIGAGHGDDLLIAKNFTPKSKLHGIEVHETYANELRQLGIAVHALDIEKDALPFASQSIDVIIANQIMEHVKEIFWVLHEISRTLKFGGSLIIGVPNLASFHNRLLLLCGRQPSTIQNNSAHVRGYTKNDLLNLLNSCFPGGYDLRMFGGSNYYPFPSFLAKPIAKIFPNSAWSIFLLLRKVKSYDRQFLEFPVINQLETNFYLGKEV
jgi:SAM-dependent methyltransferase